MGKSKQNLYNHLLQWVYDPLKLPTPRLLLETPTQACTYSWVPSGITITSLLRIQMLKSPLEQHDQRRQTSSRIPWDEETTAASVSELVLPPLPQPSWRHKQEAALITVMSRRSQIN